jgi:hypothetical protein
MSLVAQHFIFQAKKEFSVSVYQIKSLKNLMVQTTGNCVKNLDIAKEALEISLHPSDFKLIIQQIYYHFE